MLELQTGPRSELLKNKSASTQETQAEVVRVPSAQEKIAEDVAVKIANAELLLRFGEKDLAQNLLREVLAVNSFQPQALKKIATTLPAEKQIPVLKSLLTVDYSFENLVQYAHALYALSQDKEAFEVYQEALSTMTFETRELFEVYKNMGNILVREGDFDGAEEFYNKAFAINSQSDVLLVNLGTLQVQRQDDNAALERFRSALTINPKNDKAWVGLALVHNKMGDFELAQANIENAIDSNPQNRTAVHLAGQWAVRDQKYSMAIEFLQNYLATVDSDEEMSLVLIHLYCLVSQFDLALLEVDRVLLWNPKNKQVQDIEMEIRSQFRK